MPARVIPLAYLANPTSDGLQKFLVSTYVSFNQSAISVKISKSDLLVSSKPGVSTRTTSSDNSGSFIRMARTFCVVDSRESL